MKNLKFNDYRLVYIDGTGNETSMLIRAKNKSHCERIFRRDCGMYHIIKIEEIK